jgi:hypothetical protein
MQRQRRHLQSYFSTVLLDTVPVAVIFAILLQSSGQTNLKSRDILRSVPPSIFAKIAEFCFKAVLGRRKHTKTVEVKRKIRYLNVSMCLRNIGIGMFEKCELAV